MSAREQEDPFKANMALALRALLDQAKAQPWETRATHADETTRWVRLPFGRRITVGVVDKASREHDALLAALARLVSAAPELLAALEHLMRYDFGNSDGAVEARAAIAKARGES